MYVWVSAFPFKQKNKTAIIVNLSSLSALSNLQKRSYCVSIFTKNCLPPPPKHKGEQKKLI